MKQFMVLLVAMLLCLQTYAQDTKTKEILLTADNTLSLRDAFTADSVSKLEQEASKMNSTLPSGYPIYLFLYTPGGSIQDGLELFEYLKGLNRPVHTITLFAASMGFQTVQQLGERYIMRYGVLMSHKARGGFQGEFGGGMSQLDSRYGMWLRRIDMMDKDTVARTGGKQTLESYRNSYAPELWLNGQEAVEKGYADAVVTVKCEQGLETKVVEEEYDMMFFSIKATFSACPVKTAPLTVTANVSTNKGSMTIEEFVQKGGKFGNECRNSEEITDNYYNEAKVIPAQTCLVDKAITLDQIKKSIKDKKEYLNRDLKDNVIYSY